MKVKINKSSFILSDKDRVTLNSWLGNQEWLSRYNNLNGKKLVSFYDDDDQFYFSIYVPIDIESDGKPSPRWDNNMLVLQDLLGDMYGVTKALVDGKTI